MDMSEKHNQQPTTRKKLSQYRKTIQLNLANQWNSFDLDLFHVDFPPKQLRGLTEVIGDRFYQLDPDIEIDRCTYLLNAR